MTMSEPLRHPHLKRLHMFKAPNGQSANWYCGFHINGVYKRASTKTDDWKEACGYAETWYHERQYELRNGLVQIKRGKKLLSLVERTAQRMEQQGKSADYIAGVRFLLSPGQPLHEFFKDKTACAIDERSWDDFRVWLEDRRAQGGQKSLSEATLHQFKNALRLVLKQAYVDKHIDRRPVLPDVMRMMRKDSRPRVYFSSSEYRTLLRHSRSRIKTRGGLGRADAEELHDYIIFMTNTGLRVSESKALRFRDVSIVKGDVVVAGKAARADVCEIVVTKGKRGGHGPAVSFIGAPKVFLRLVARRGIADPAASNELIFSKHQVKAFRELLREAQLYSDQYGRKRDFVALRHTYICFRLASGVSVFDVAQNTRTSASIIQQRYASALTPSSLKMNITTWGKEP